MQSPLKLYSPPQGDLHVCVYIYINKVGMHGSHTSPMATSISYLASRAALVFVVALLEYYLISLNHLVISANSAPNNNYCRPIEANDTDLIQFALNLEFLEAEFFLHGALGEGLDAISPNLALDGPPPIGGHKANLNPLVAPIIQEFGYQEVGHIRSNFL